MEIGWTIFADHAAQVGQYIEGSWSQLLEHIERAGPYESKKACPWFKGARFGTQRTLRGSLRSDGNVLGVWVLEGDYDGGVISVASAIEMLESHGIRAAIYTSPSHMPARPRWRVLAPFSVEHAPEARALLLGRLNGALGGILAQESYVLSQAYYYGRAGNAEYSVAVTFGDSSDGTPIDEINSLDQVAVARKRRPGADGGSHDFAQEVARLGRALRTGDGRRALLKSYIGARSNRGLPQDEIRVLVDDASRRFFDPGDPINSADIDALISDITAADQAQRDQVQGTVGPFLASLEEVKKSGLVPVDLRGKADAQEWWLDGYIPAGQLTLLSAHGGTGKSYFALMYAVCSAAEIMFLGKQTKKSKVLYYSAEDPASLILYRLKIICQSLGVMLEDIIQNLIIIDATERDDCALWIEKRVDGTQIGAPTAEYFDVQEYVEEHGIDQLIIDNASDTYAGNEINRGQVRGFVRALVKLVRVRGGAVLLLSHVDKGTSRAGKSQIDDEGYSGSTAWHNSARSRLFLVERDGGLQLLHQKCNVGPRQKPLLIDWPAGGVPVVAQAASPVVVAIEARQHTRALLKLILQYAERGEHISVSRIGSSCAKRLFGGDPGYPNKLSTEQVAHLLHRAEAKGWLEKSELKSPGRHAREIWRLLPAGIEEAQHG